MSAYACYVSVSWTTMFTPVLYCTVVIMKLMTKMTKMSFLFFFWFQYPAALMNLGAILHLNGKLQEAEANYLRALQLKPDDTITQSNLRKLWNIMEKQGLRTTSPWAHPYRLPAMCVPDLGKGLPTCPSFTPLIRERWKRHREDVCSERPLLCCSVLLMTPELCIQLRPAAFLRSIAHSLAGATVHGIWTPKNFLSKLVLSQESCFYFQFFFSFISTALELDVRP